MMALSDVIEDIINQHREEYLQLLGTLLSVDNEDVNNVGHAVIESANENLTIDDMSTICHINFRLYCAIVSRDRKYLNNTCWLELDDDKKNTIWYIALKSLEADFTGWDYVIEALLIGKLEFSQLARIMLQEKCNNCTEIALNYANEHDIVNECCLLNICDNTNQLCNWVSEQTRLNECVSRCVVRKLSNIKLSDTNLTETKCIKICELLCVNGLNRQEDAVLLYNLSFLYPKSNGLLKYYSLSFQVLYGLVIANKLSNYKWELIENNTAEVAIRQSWDHGKRMRKKAVERYREMGLKKSDIVHFTKDEALNIELAKMW